MPSSRRFFETSHFENINAGNTMLEGNAINTFVCDVKKC